MMVAAFRCAVLVNCMLAFADASHAQTQHAQPDLVFPKDASGPSFFSPIAMGIWKPDGPGPFPAVILVHSCGGMKKQIGDWRGEAIKRGYVVFIIDSFTSRGSPNCRPIAPTPMTRGVKDVLDAGAHLATLPFVDKSRIGMIGFSWGAMAGMLAGSPAYVADVAPARERLVAAVALYPSCHIGPFGTFPGNEYLRPDVATPTLLLLGEKDTESPPEECTSRMAVQKERGNPVEVVVFKDATHCWDCSDQHNQRRTPPWAAGREVVYLYDSKVTGESVERAFEFLGRRMPPAGKT